MIGGAAAESEKTPPRGISLPLVLMSRRHVGVSKGVRGRNDHKIWYRTCRHCPSHSSRPVGPPQGERAAKGLMASGVLVPQFFSVSQSWVFQRVLRRRVRRCLTRCTGRCGAPREGALRWGGSEAPQAGPVLDGGRIFIGARSHLPTAFGSVGVCSRDAWKRISWELVGWVPWRGLPGRDPGGWPRGLRACHRENGRVMMDEPAVFHVKHGKGSLAVGSLELARGLHIRRANIGSASSWMSKRELRAENLKLAGMGHGGVADGANVSRETKIPNDVRRVLPSSTTIERGELGRKGNQPRAVGGLRGRLGSRR